LSKGQFTKDVLQHFFEEVGPPPPLKDVLGEKLRKEAETEKIQVCKVFTASKRCHVERQKSLIFDKSQ
jgi:hypothetical protein